MSQPYPQQPGYPQQYVPRPPKEVGYAYLWMLASLFLVCGLQHFYLGKIGRGILWLLTGGLFGIGLIVDLFTLPAQTRQVNAQRALGLR